MKIDKNFKNGFPRIVLGNEDIPELVQIINMFDSEGWKTFKKYLESEKIKLNRMTLASVSSFAVAKERTEVEVAKEAGFQHFLDMEDILRLKLEKLQEDMNPTEETNGRDDAE